MTLMFTLRNWRPAYRVVALCVCVLALTVGGLFARMRLASSQDKAKVGGTNKPKQVSYADIAHAYHGLLLDHSLNEIKVDRDSLKRLQDSMLESLTLEPYFNEKFVANRSNTKIQRPKPALDKDYVNKVLNGFKFTDQERMLTKSALIQMGINSAPINDRQEYQWRFDLIHERTVYQNPGFEDHRPDFERYMASVNLSEVLRLLNEGLLDVPNYIGRCQDNEVPIPPDFPSGDWGRPRLLSFEFNFLGTGRDTEVLTFQAPEGQGLCYALPRKDGGDIGFLGIICQSKRTGKACFWDNVRLWTRCRNNPSGEGCRISGADISFRITELQGGLVLRENCTQCHRGQNAFIIHPETALGYPRREIRDPDPDVRYSPLGQATWSNPPPFEAAGSSACSGCHEIADPTPSYCRILEKAANLTMPPEAPSAGWRAPSMDFAASIRHLQTRCPLGP
jgi:hypothetical protein